MGTETPEVRLTIGSSFEELDLVDSLADAVLRHLGLPEEEFEHTSLAIHEAAANAIEHGNGPGSSKRVEVFMRLEAAKLTVTVRDQGDGFDPDAVPDPLAPENLLKPRGRGIFLTRRFVDEVEYRFEEGTVMVLRKRLDRTTTAGSTEEAG